MIKVWKKTHINDCITYSVVLRYVGTDTLGGSLGGGSLVVKVGINRTRISADENSQ